MNVFSFKGWVKCDFQVSTIKELSKVHNSKAKALFGSLNSRHLRDYNLVRPVFHLPSFSDLGRTIIYRNVTESIEEEGN